MAFTFSRGAQAPLPPCPSMWALMFGSPQIPSYVDILDGAICRTVGREVDSFVDDLADGWPADDVTSSTGHVSTRDVCVADVTEIDRRLGVIFAENVQQILSDDVSATVRRHPQCLHYVVFINIEKITDDMQDVIALQTANLSSCDL